MIKNSIPKILALCLLFTFIQVSHVLFCHGNNPCSSNFGLYVDINNFRLKECCVRHCHNAVKKSYVSAAKEYNKKNTPKITTLTISFPQTAWEGGCHSTLIGADGKPNPPPCVNCHTACKDFQPRSTQLPDFTIPVKNMTNYLKSLAKMYAHIKWEDHHQAVEAYIKECE